MTNLNPLCLNLKAGKKIFGFLKGWIITQIKAVAGFYLHAVLCEKNFIYLAKRQYLKKRQIYYRLYMPNTYRSFPFPLLFFRLLKAKAVKAAAATTTTTAAALLSMFRVQKRESVSWTQKEKKTKQEFKNEKDKNHFFFE